MALNIVRGDAKALAHLPPENVCSLMGSRVAIEVPEFFKNTHQESCRSTVQVETPTLGHWDKQPLDVGGSCWRSPNFVL